jgi:hypothetical protein
VDPSERDEILRAFAALVTMPPREYEAWLRTRACKSDAVAALSRGFTAADGRRTARLLRKAPEDVTVDDLAQMRRASDHVRRLLAARPPPDRVDAWRDALRNAGHDPWAPRAPRATHGGSVASAREGRLA